MAEHQRYKVTERIDAGGMAEVFRGVAESLQGFKKNVAIKRILPHLTKNKKFISMFLDEAKLSLHLQHANIVGVFDIGVAPPDGNNPGAYFIVMEFVDGSHLKGVIESLRRQGKRMRVAHTLYLMMEVCKGLAYAHDVGDAETGRPLGIVHRDISPPNILLSKNGEVKLVDFGLAKATSQLEHTDPGVVKGKFSYLSPEAASGKDVDRRADIFAVGVLLYELLTGKRLFYGESDYQTVELVRACRVPSLTAQNDEVDADLEAVVRKALAKDVEQRYQTGFELQDAIAQHLFAHNLKVTSRDIAQLVQECVRERQQHAPARPVVKSLINELISDEMLKFTSLEGSAPLDVNSPSPDGAPTAAAGPAGSQPLDGGSFIDTRGWADEDPTHIEGMEIDDAPAAKSASPAQTPVVEARPTQKPATGRHRIQTPHGVPMPAKREEVSHSGLKPLADLLEKENSGETTLTPSKAAAVAATESARETEDEPARSAAGRWVAIFVAVLLLVGGGVYFAASHHLFGK